MSPFFDRVRLQWRGRARPLLVQEGPEGPSICPGATLYNSAQTLSRWLRARGVRQGHSLAFRCPTALDWVAVALSGAKLGLRLTLDAQADWWLDETGSLVGTGEVSAGATPGWSFGARFVSEAELVERLETGAALDVVHASMDWHTEAGALHEALPALWSAEEIHVPQWSVQPAFVLTRTAME